MNCLQDLPKTVHSLAAPIICISCCYSVYFSQCNKFHKKKTSLRIMKYSNFSVFFSMSHCGKKIVILNVLYYAYRYVGSHILLIFSCLVVNSVSCINSWTALNIVQVGSFNSTSTSGIPGMLGPFKINCSLGWGKSSLSGTTMVSFWPGGGISRS